MSRAHSVNLGRRSRRLEIEPLEDRIVPAITPVTTDLWDVNQGNTITANSVVVGPPIYSSPFLSNIRNMFGNVQAGVIEPTNTLFQDFEAPGSVDFVEWQTPSAMTLRSFHLIAAHDGAPRNFNQRGFNRFTLYAQNPTTLAFDKIFEIFPASSYGNTTPPSNGYLDVAPGGNVLRLSANLTPIVAQTFRAEFVQQGVGSTESGVRIVELDGFDTFDTAGPIPNVAPTANVGGPYSVPEGGSVPLDGSASSDPDGTIATYQWDLNYVAPNFDIDATGVAPGFSAAGLNGPSSRTVALRVIDNLGAVSAVATTTITITNVPPGGAADNATVTVNEGATASNTGTFSDPAEPVNLSASVGTVIDTGGGNWSWSFNTSGAVGQTVTIFGDDGAGAVPIASFSLVINNSTTIQLQINPPQINLNGNGVFQVVALSTPAFLATSLDPATLRLSGAAPSHVAFSDFDNDGDLDLVMHFLRSDFVDEYAAALSADLDDGILDSIHQAIYLSLLGTTFSGNDVTGAAWVDMFMTGKYLDNLI